MNRTVAESDEHLPSGRMGRSIALHSIAAAAMFISPLSLFVPAAIIHSGLRHGRRGTVGVAGISALLLIVLFSASAGDAGLAPAMAHVGRFIFEVAAPSIIAFLLIEKAASFGRVLTTAILSSGTGILATELSLRMFFGYSPYEAIVTNFRAVSNDGLDIYRGAGLAPEMIRMMERLSDTVASSFMPAVLLSVVALTFVFSLILVPRLPAGRDTGERYMLRSLVLPDALLVAFVLGGLSPLASGPLRLAGLNLLAIVIILYFIQGLAVFRALVTKVGFGPIGTMIAFLMLGLMLVYGIAPFALALVGLFDSFFDFRKLNRKDDSNESHTD
ncbi:MAG TPA: DUF2232 domain-containing protein [Thermoanaerobaculia bacterium]|nr:DUF2232 domain-containing protein [Thermoanaerobaculia bacterium]